jgi:hypothetical protein
VTAAEHHTQAERCLDKAGEDFERDRLNSARYWLLRSIAHGLLSHTPRPAGWLTQEHLTNNEHQPTQQAGTPQR